MLHGGQCLAMRRQNGVGVLRKELGLEGVNHDGEANHLTFPHSEKPAISVLIACWVLASVVAVRWVYLAVLRMER